VSVSKRNTYLVMTVILLVVLTYIVKDNDNINKCLASVKVKTTMTTKQKKFTGDWQELSGVLFCYDTDGNLYPYRPPGGH